MLISGGEEEEGGTETKEREEGEEKEGRGSENGRK